MPYNKRLVAKGVGVVFALLGIVQVLTTRRYIWPDILFVTVGLLLWFDVLPVTRYFRKKA